MDPIDKKIRALREFQDNTTKIILDEVKQRERFLITRITTGQMWGLGIDGMGKQIGQYTARTIEIKQAKGQRTDHMTLRDTEAYHQSAVVEIDGDAFSVRFLDEKSDMLRYHYGEAIESPTEDTLNQVIDLFLKERMANELKKKL